MPRRYLSLLDVHDNMKGWTVLLQVVERCNVQLSRGTPPTKFRRFLLTDSQGTKVSAVIYGNDIRYFLNLLQPYKRYYISNASVRKASPAYRVSEYEFSWVINNTTLVEEHIDATPPTFPCTIQLTNFSDLYKYADTENLQNLQAIVIHAFPVKEQGPDSTTREFVIVNQEKKPMLLTVWNEFEENQGKFLADNIANAPAIIAMRVKVTTFNSLSLTTRLSSCLLINPPSFGVESLRDWYKLNKEEIVQLVEQKVYKDSDKLLPSPDENNILNIQQALNSLKNIKTAWIRGNTTLVKGQSRFWYTACINCQKSLNADLEWVITCPSCKEETHVEVRCRIGILLSDETGSLAATIYGADAEKLITLSAIELKESDEQGFKLNDELAASIQKYTIVCFLRYYDFEHQGQNNAKYSVVKAYTTEELLIQSLLNTSDDTSTLLADHPSSDELALTNAANKANDEQMFTPTTKKVLESISSGYHTNENASSSMLTVKKNIPFEDPEFDDVTPKDSTANTKTTTSEKKVYVSKSAQPSPLKKKRA